MIRRLVLPLYPCHDMDQKYTTATNEGLTNGRIEAIVKCNTDRKPSCVTVRLPHPTDSKPIKVTGGRYISHRETVVIDNFDGEAQVTLEFE